MLWLITALSLVLLSKRFSQDFVLSPQATSLIS